MSVESITLVLNHSRAKGTAKLVLVGIANHDGDGGAWPSIATLCRYANVDRRTVQRAITELVELGEVVVHANDGGTRTTRNDQRPNRYEITVSERGADGAASVPPRSENGAASVSARGGAGVANGAAPTPPEPSLNHPEPRGEGYVRTSPGRAAGETPPPSTASTDQPAPLARPDRCATHQGVDDPPPCVGCKRARLAAEADAEAAAREQVAERARRRREALALRAAEVRQCRLCDDDGRTPGGLVCSHDPEQIERARRGVAAARAAMRKGGDL